ncbi:AT-hook motif nuclear-localized protein 10-like [Rutidosis leptorrhynchoides]|uniref:AT-hook motif nuclear-localized protein 10-like n=1 Tax=Rutidosis leptorrhynchoides TaxID=125765 RepID=UPI003A9913EC
MDSRESLAPPQPPPQRHPPPHLHHHQMLSPAMMMPPNSYPTHHQQHHHLQPHNSNTAPVNNHSIISQESMQQRFNFDGSDQYGCSGDGSSPPGGFGVSGFSIEPARKKRGRPRKYKPAPDGNIALGLAPAVIGSGGGGGGHLESSNDGGGGTPNTDSAAKKQRGRPPGSGKKQLDALGSPGVGFTPHVITVKAREDIASKITSFSQQGPRTVCILSANGAISNVTLRQPATPGGTVTYEGRFEIISLSGSFMLSDSRSSGLSVSLAGSDGRVLGGGVAGSLVAATPVQVIVGSFIVDNKKPKSSNATSAAAQPSNMLSFGGGGSVPGASPQSDEPLSESSDDSGSSPVHRPQGTYNNANQQQQQASQMPMYSNMGWPNNSNMNMLLN